MGEFEGDGDGNDNVSKFPNRAARYRNSYGYDRKGTNRAAAPPDNLANYVPPEPLTEEELLGISNDMVEDLTPLALENPAWGITEAVIEDKVALLLAEAGGSTRTLIQYLEEAARRDISQTKSDIVLHLAAAKAYLDIIELDKREATADT